MSDHTSKLGSYTEPLYLRALERTENELRPISERTNAAGRRENDADIQVVCELAENVRDAITEYQVSPDLPLAPRMHC